MPHQPATRPCTNNLLVINFPYSVPVRLTSSPNQLRKIALSASKHGREFEVKEALDMHSVRPCLAMAGQVTPPHY